MRRGLVLLDWSSFRVGASPGGPGLGDWGQREGARDGAGAGG